MINYNRRLLKHTGVFLIFTLLILTIITPVAYGQDTSNNLDFLRQQILQKYVDELTLEDLAGNTPQEIFSNLDVHSQFFTQKEMQRFLQQITGEFAGIGVQIQRRDDKIIINSVIKDTPAERAGLLPEDEIYSVDGTLLRGVEVQEASDLIRGPEGTKVNITINRRGNKEPLKFEITRAPITTSTVSSEVIDGIGYIRVSMFNEKTHTHFLNAMGDLVFQQQVRDVIIDLRDNPGGSLDAVVRMARVLVPRGPIVHIDHRRHRVSAFSFLRKPIVEGLAILVNEGSASASEILAAAVKDTNAGVIIGTQTYGKGSVQRLYVLPDGSGYKLTEARYRSPNNHIIEGIGVEPHHIVERFYQTTDIDNVFSRENDQQLSFALDYFREKRQQAEVSFR